MAGLGDTMASHDTLSIVLFESRCALWKGDALALTQDITPCETGRNFIQFREACDIALEDSPTQNRFSDF